MSATDKFVLAVTGTDTGVGKTRVSRGLLRALNESQMTVLPLKWVETGCDNEHPEHTDADALARAANATQHIETVGPLRFKTPAAPTVAARNENRALSIDSYLPSLTAAKAVAQCDWVLVEGAGGALVPMTDELSFAALCAEAGVTHAIIVARSTLGTINHSALTIEALRHRGITVVALVLNASSGATDDSSSAVELQRLFGSLVLGPLPYDPSCDDDALAVAVTACGLVDRVRSAAAEWGLRRTPRSQ